MNRADYDRYLDCFHRRDHEAVLGFWACDFEVRFAGYTLRGPDELRRFYRFFHAHVRETIVPSAVLGDGRHLFIECTVHLQAERELSASALQAQGFGNLVPLAAGQVVELPQFIHYALDAQGRFTRATCVVLM